MNVDRINGKDIHTFVINGKGNSQVIRGGKIIPNDLYINGSTILHNVNNINLEKLQSSTFNTEGNQTLTGIFEIEDIVTDR